MPHRPCLEISDLKKLLSLTSSSRATLSNILTQFQSSYSGKYDRKNMNDAQKQQAKRGMSELTKEKLIVKIPKARGVYLLNPYIFQTLFNHHEKIRWDELVINSTKNVPKIFKQVPQIFTAEAMKKISEQIKRINLSKSVEAINSLQKEPHDKQNQTIKQTALQNTYSTLDMQLIYFKIAIDEFIHYVKQQPIGLNFSKSYDTTLPSVRFRKTIDVHNALDTLDPNLCILSRLTESTFVYNHNEECIQKEQNGEKCDCAEKAFDSIKETLTSQEWFDRVSYKCRHEADEIQKFAQEWFKEFYPDWFI